MHRATIVKLLQPPPTQDAAVPLSFPYTDSTPSKEYTIFRNQYGVYVSGQCPHLNHLLNGELGIPLRITEPFKLFKPLEYYNEQFLERHSFHMSADNGLFVGGMNDKYQLGLGDEWVTKLVRSATLFKHSIPYCGSNHTFWLINGKLYGVGDNSKGQIGVSTSQQLVKTPTLITHDCDNEPFGYVTSVTCSLDSTIICTRDGKCYSTGHNSFGQLGLGDCLNRRRFTLIKVLKGKEVTGVVCMHMRTFFTIVCHQPNDQYHYIVACGYNSNGCLGVFQDKSSSRLIVSIPSVMLVRDGPDPDKLYPPMSLLSTTKPEIRNSHNHFTAIVATHHHRQRPYQMLYTCGNNKHGQLGNESNSMTSHHLLQPIDTGFAGVPFSRDQIVDVALGTNHMIIIYVNGFLKGCGSNDKGQLGDTDNMTMLKKLTNLKLGSTWMRAKSVSSSFDSTIVQTLRHSTYVTGCNENGQLGLGDRLNRASFTLVQFPGSFLYSDHQCC
jgi:alpha-tubulin suppressor-like RCC1 family protein